MPELLVDFITSLDGYGAADGWPGWWGLEGPEYLAWLVEQPEGDYTVLMGATTYRHVVDEPEGLHALLTSGLGLKLRRLNPVVQRLTRALAGQTQPASSPDIAARTGAAVPGQTACALVTNLVWRTFGHSATGRAESVLDWAGLFGTPAGPVVEVANRHRIASATLSNRVRQARNRGIQTPLNPLQLRDATRATQPTEDHLSRQRIAQLLGLPQAPATIN